MYSEVLSFVVLILMNVVIFFYGYVCPACWLEDMLQSELLLYQFICSKFWVVFCDIVLVIFWDLEWTGLWEMDIVKVRLLGL